MKKVFTYFYITLFCLFSLSLVVFADSSLPSGYKTLEDVFDVSQGDGTQPYDYRNYDGVVLQLYYFQIVSDVSIRSITKVPIGIDKETPSYESITQSISSYPVINFELGKKKEGFTVSGNCRFRHNYSSESGLYEDGEYIEYIATASVSISNIWMNKEKYNRMTADLSCTVEDKHIANGEEVESANYTFSVENSEMHFKKENEQLVAYLSYVDKANTAYSVIVNFKVLGLRPMKGGSFSEITTDADEDAGEIDFKVPGAIAVGVAAGASALVGTGIELEEDEDKKKRGFKMRVQKDFGNSVRRNLEEPVVVRARMIEIDEEGKEINRDDLTAKITAYASGFDVVNTQINGKYFESYIKVSEGYSEDKATLTFEFNGEGGTFKNNIVFKVIDGPSIKFMEETEKGSGEYNLYTAVTSIDIIEGDNFTYKRRFCIEDAMENPKPSEFKIEKPDGLEVSIEQVNGTEVYDLVVKNNTKAPAEEEKDIFKEPYKLDIKFSVLIKGEKDNTEGFANVSVYQEGITVSSEKKEEYKSVKYVRVKACKKENISEFDKEWQISEFNVLLAVKGESESFINPSDIQFSYEKLRNSEGLGCDVSIEDSLAKKYKHKVTHGFMNDKYRVQFEPNDCLEEPTDGTFYVLFLPISCSSHSKTYNANVPLRLKGKVYDPMAGWEEEYKKFIQRVEEYSVSDNKDKWLERAEKYANDPRASKEELRLATKQLIKQYMTYWTVESQGHIEDANLYDTIISDLEWVKFFGDCAFSFLVAAYAGPVAEAIISPAKDYFVECVGEIIACYTHGTSVDIDKFSINQTLASMGDNIMANNISLKNWKKAAVTLACYFVYSSIKHLLLTMKEKGEFDLYGSIIKAFGDLTIQGLKAGASVLFDKWIKDNKQFQEKLGDYINKTVNKFMRNGGSFDIKNFVGKNLGKGRTINLKDQKIANVQYRLNKSLHLEGRLGQIAGFKGASKKVAVTKIDYLEKVLIDLFGSGVSSIVESVTEGVTGAASFVPQANGDIEYRFVYEDDEENVYTIKVMLIKCIGRTTGKFFELLYNELFGEVPSATDIVSAPKEPELPSRK